MKPLYIFDLDGTLALCDHRRPILEDKDNPNRWDDFYKACVHDKPNMPLILLCDTLLLQTIGEFLDGDEENANDVYFFSGRSESVRRETTEWLLSNIALLEDEPISNLWMRSVSDFTPDEELKRKWYDELDQEDKNRLVCVFDDRQKVVDMWRSIGVTCLQVAKGDF